MNTLSDFLAGGEGGEVAVPGDPDDSYFLELASEDTDEHAPKGPGLSKAEVEMLHQWVAEGMEWL